MPQTQDPYVLRYPVYLAVRTGKGTVSGDSFTDVVKWISRVAVQHAKGWWSVNYERRRYQLFGGIRTCQFICLNNPLPQRPEKQN